MVSASSSSSCRPSSLSVLRALLQAFWHEKGFLGEIWAQPSAECPLSVTLDGTSPSGSAAIVGISSVQASNWSSREVTRMERWLNRGRVGGDGWKDGWNDMRHRREKQGRENREYTLPEYAPGGVRVYMNHKSCY